MRPGPVDHKGDPCTTINVWTVQSTDSQPPGFRYMFSQVSPFRSPPPLHKGHVKNPTWFQALEGSLVYCQRPCLNILEANNLSAPPFPGGWFPRWFGLVRLGEPLINLAVLQLGDWGFFFTKFKGARAKGIREDSKDSPSFEYLEFAVPSTSWKSWISNWNWRVFSLHEIVNQPKQMSSKGIPVSGLHIYNKNHQIISSMSPNTQPACPFLRLWPLEVVQFLTSW